MIMVWGVLYSNYGMGCVVMVWGVLYSDYGMGCVVSTAAAAGTS